jgi:hypothetical protein
MCRIFIVSGRDRLYDKTGAMRTNAEVLGGLLEERVGGLLRRGLLAERSVGNLLAGGLLGGSSGGLRCIAVVAIAKERESWSR